MTYVRWLRLMVFDLDCTLWPFHVELLQHPPPFTKVDGQVLDKFGKKIPLFPDTMDILEHWSKRCEIAVASRTTYPQGALKLINLFGMDKYIKYHEIYPGSKWQHIMQLHKASGFPLSEMILFDDEMRNLRDMKNLGVDAVLIDSEVGVTKQLISEEVAKRFTDAKLY